MGITVCVEMTGFLLLEVESVYVANLHFLAHFSGPGMNKKAKERACSLKRLCQERECTRSLNSF
jgi:hypothetical protein